MRASSAGPAHAFSRPCYLVVILVRMGIFLLGSWILVLFPPLLLKVIFKGIDEHRHFLDADLWGGSVGVRFHWVGFQGIERSRRRSRVIDQSTEDGVLAVKVRQGSVSKKAEDWLASKLFVISEVWGPSSHAI